MSVDLLANASRKARDLEDENLCAALQLAEGDERWNALLCPPLDPAKCGTDVQLFDERHVMCPDLYLATLSGSINRVNELLGLTNETTTINDASPDVQVVFEDTPENQLGGKFHGDGLCTLQEVTAGKNTMLHIAAEQGHVELVKLLFRMDYTLLTSENSSHQTPLHLAARAGNHGIISLIVFLAQQSPIGVYEVLTKRSIHGDTVLHEAVRNGHERAVQVFMTAAPALSAEVNNASISPLYLAVVRKSVGVVNALLEYKHASAAGPKKQNALHAAVLGNPDITSMLLHWRPELAYERDDDSGSIPLHYAASDGDVDVVQEILDRASSAVYIQDKEGWSPLHVAARMCHYSVIELMINRCSDSVELRDNEGRNFLHIVALHGGRISSSLKNVLYHHGSKKLAKPGNKINLDHRHCLEKIVHERDNNGNTPLHCASMNGSSDMIKELIKLGADETLINNDGKTALDYSISQGSVFLMAHSTIALVNRGATFGPQRQDKLDHWKSEGIIEKLSKNLIVVCILIATVALSAAFNVPGSYSGDGIANLRLKKQYNIFIVFDTLAMSASMTAVMLLVVGKAVTERAARICFAISLNLLWICLFTMELAFVLAVSVALGNGKYATKTLVCFLPMVFFTSTIIVTTLYCFPKPWTVYKFLMVSKDQQTRRQIEIQRPTLTTYIRISSLFVILNIFFYLTIIGFLWYAGNLSYSISQHDI
ncbi:hypothetical protein LUZ61_019752 [Rhynchospora tenuis]|uniref:PGG domain-containing protein n=1 Tax=Rhynchospora tenuis TaxID=198213 RepID=A0AAD6EN61_9POAL|nr:hypothetical protein LUZ61_019752 [Rhynchospora tenuis]